MPDRPLNIDLLRRSPFFASAGEAAMTRLLRQCEANVVFLRNKESKIAKWLGFGASSAALPCPAIYVGDRLTVPNWNLQRAMERRPLRGMSALITELGLQ